MANSKVIVEILEVLRLHKKDEDICKSGFDAIANQTKNNGNKNKHKTHIVLRGTD